MWKRILPVCVCMAGCSYDVVARYPSPPGESGAIDIVLNDPTRALTVEINDLLVVGRAHSRKIHVDGVPAGTARVRVATGGRCEQGVVTEREVTVMPMSISTLALPGPEPNHACMVYAGLALLALSIEVVAESMVEIAALHRRVSVR